MKTLNCVQVCYNCTIDQDHRVESCSVCDYCRKTLDHPDSFTKPIFSLSIFEDKPRKTGQVGYYRFDFEYSFEMATRNDASLLDHVKILAYRYKGIGDTCFRKRWCKNTLHVFDTLNIIYMNETCPIIESNDRFKSIISKSVEKADK
jgi:hypothetical protein